MKMKRLLSWILTAALLVGVMPLTYAAGNDTEAADQEMVSILTDLGIIRSYQPESYVALSDLTTALTVITGNRNAIDQYFDSDRIRANRALKFSELLVVLVDITGYTPYLDLMYAGVNQTGYTTLASKVGITRGVTVKYNENITGADFARMIYNTLFVDILQQTVFGNKPRYHTNDGENILTQYMKLIPVKGVVRAAGITSLDETGWYSDASKVQEIRIDGYNYNCSTAFLEEDIVGRTVEAYIIKETNTVAAIVIPEDENNILKLTGDDLKQAPTVKTPSFSYLNESGTRTVTGRLSQTVDVVYNGALLPDYDGKHFTEGDTVITMVDNDLDKIYDVVLIDDYESFIFNQISTDEKTVVDINGISHDFTGFVDNNLSFVDYSGKKISVDTLESGSVISVRFDKDRQPNRAFVSKERVQGALLQINKNERSIVLDDNEYICEKRYYNSGSLDSISLGSGVTAYLDVWGRVALVEIYEGVLKFAWVFDAMNGESFTPARLLMIDEDNVNGEVVTSDKITFNGSRIDCEQLLSQTELLDNAGSFKPQLIRFRKNARGEVTIIETAVTNHELGGTMSSPDAFELNYEYTGKDGHTSMKPATINNKKWLGTKYVAPATTLLFSICPDEKELSHVGTASSLSTDSGLKLSLYNVDEDYTPQVIVEKTNAYTNTAYVYNYGAAYILDEIMWKLDSEGNTVMQISAYKGDGKGVKATFDVENPRLTAQSFNIIFYNWLESAKQQQIKSLPISKLPKGTVFQVQTLPGTDELRSFGILYIPGEEFGIPTFVDSTDTSASSANWEDAYHFSGNGLSSYAKVLKKTIHGVVINSPYLDYKDELGETQWNRHIMFSDSNDVFVVDTATGDIELGTWADINVGDMLYLHRLYNSIYAAVVYR